MAVDLRKEAERINKIGDQFRKKKDWKNALEYYKDSVDLAQQSGDMKKFDDYTKELEEAIAQRGKEINTQGDICIKKKEYLNALNAYTEAYNLLVSAGEKWVKKMGKEFLGELNKAKIAYAKEILIKEAENLVKANKFEDASVKFDEATKLVPLLMDNGPSKSAYKFYDFWGSQINTQGDKLYKDKKFEEAIPIYLKSVELINKSDSEGKKKDFKKELSKAFAEHASLINKKGDELMKQGQFMKAAEIYRQSVEIAKESNNQKLVANFQAEMEKSYQKFAEQINTKGDELFKSKKYEESALIYRNSVNIAQEANNQKLIDNFTKEMRKAYLEAAKEINTKGDNAFKEGKFQDSYNLYDKSVQLAEQADDKGKIKDYRKERDKAMAKIQ